MIDDDDDDSSSNENDEVKVVNDSDQKGGEDNVTEKVSQVILTLINVVLYMSRAVTVPSAHSAGGQCKCAGCILENVLLYLQMVVSAEFPRSTGKK